MHSKNFEKIKDYYLKGDWNEEMLHNAVGKKYGITQEEYEEIMSLK